MNLPVVHDVPSVTAAQMRAVDQAMIASYGIQLIQMMENAGRALAALVVARFLDGDALARPVVVLAGTGGNGGGALVCARHLHNYGARVQVIITGKDGSFRPVPRHQLAILRQMDVPVTLADTLLGVSSPGTTGPDLVVPPALLVDGIVGYSLDGAPRGAAAGLIRWASAQGAPILALDVPSGVDATSGAAFNPAIRAAVTLTLALPKTGLLTPEAAAFVGELYLADIGVPPALYARLGLAVGPLFARAAIVRIR